jgi:GDP-mannose 6-dehydrogenase
MARDGHKVIAVDVNRDKIRSLNRGVSPIVEPGLAELIRDAVSTGRLRGTASSGDAVAATDMTFVCVGTPSQVNGSLDTTYIKRVSEGLGRAIRKKNDFHSVIVRSTILPGTMDRLVIPTLEKLSGKRAGRDFGIGYYPEFLREGSAIYDYDNPGGVVLGFRDDTTKDRLLLMCSVNGASPRIMDIRTAEAVKYATNAWHAVKISFANEIGLISKGLGVDGQDVMDVICADKKLNISPAYMKPGFAFGGSCLPKDLRALHYGARSMDLDTPLLDATLKANDNQIDQAFRMIEATAKRRIGIVGLSFKPETDDLRYSPLVELAERLLGRGYQVKIYDPIVRLSRLIGANREYIATRLRHIGQLLMENPDDLLSDCEVLVIGNREAAAPMLSRVMEGVTIVDLVRIDRSKRSAGQYQGICW